MWLRTWNVRRFPWTQDQLPSTRVSNPENLLAASQVNTTPQELSRLMYRKQIERALGVSGQGRLSPMDVVRAQRLDALMSPESIYESGSGEAGFRAVIRQSLL